MIFFFTTNDLNYYLAGFLNFLIASVLVMVTTILFVSFLAYFLPKSKSVASFFYPFTSATLIVIGTFGFFLEAQEKLDEYLGGGHAHNHFHDHNHHHLEEHHDEVFSVSMKMLVFGAGVVLGTIMFLVLRYLFIKKSKYVNASHNDAHNHSDLLLIKEDLQDPKKAWIALLLILMHRGIDGFFFGSVISKITNLDAQINWGLVITFIIHSIFDLLIIYYHQVNYGENKKRAAIRTIVSTALVLPTLFLGVLFYPTIQGLGWALPIVNVMGGTALTIAAIIEFVPEFIEARNAPIKKFVPVILSFMLGVIFTAMFLQMHSH